jgi:hypothetical protein
MLKIRKIKLSGFRGIKTPQELLCVKDGETKPTSFVLFGVNSSGKTSFMDGLEWFLSPENKIQWLRREDAQESAYPHHTAQQGDSYVEIEFFEDGKITNLRKTFDDSRKTKPYLSDKAGFQKIYQSFVIKPYLRYLEIVEFVLNRTGVEKYQELARWMGFESELNFQEKLAKIVSQLEKKKEQIEAKRDDTLRSMGQLIGNKVVDETNIIIYCNGLLKNINLASSGATIAQLSSKGDLQKKFSEVAKLQIQTSHAKNIHALSSIETSLAAFAINKSLFEQASALKNELVKFIGEKGLISNINAIDLYNKAQEILSESAQEKTRCPVCGLEWDREKLLAHIREELNLLDQIKIKKADLIQKAGQVKILVRSEQTAVTQAVSKYHEGQNIISSITYDAAKKYEIVLNELESSLSNDIFTTDWKLSIPEIEVLLEVEDEKVRIIKLIGIEKAKLEPSKEALLIDLSIQGLRKVNELWDKLIQEKGEHDFWTSEVSKFLEISDAVGQLIRDGIKNLFEEISSLIEEYFIILRKDKDIKNIKIDFNVTRKAEGRSAEIQLSYYDVNVKPAYKVLSESLLNSLGLSVYFACVRRFNKNCGFLVLDDIINSLDIYHRETIINLLEEKLSDFQVILFTHDDFWFERLQTRFPHWVRKKIKKWEYDTGPRIDYAKTTKEELDSLLGEDETKAKEAGMKYGEYLEGVLHELCEKIEAKIKYRYFKQEIPAMYELFEAVCERLKNILGEKHNLVVKIKKAWQSDPLIRNFCMHDKRNYASSISLAEVKSSYQNWFDEVEKNLRCPECHKIVEYVKAKGQEHLQCQKGHLKLK